MFIPEIDLTAADSKRLGELAEQFFGQTDCSGLAKEAERLFARRAPWSDVRVAHWPTGFEESQIRLAVFIDYHLPQAVFLTKGQAGE